MGKRTTAPTVSEPPTEPDIAADAGMTDDPSVMFAAEGTPTDAESGEPGKADAETGEAGTQAEDTTQTTEGSETSDQGKEKEKQQDAATPAPKVLTFRGEKLTPEQLAQRILANPDIAEDLTQTYAQFPAIQRKHIELLEAARAAEAAKAAGATKPDAGAKPASEQIEAMDPKTALKVFQEGLQPRVKHLVDVGLISQDTAEINPDLAYLTAYALAKLEEMAQFRAGAEKVYAEMLVPMFQSAEQVFAASQQKERDDKLDARLGALAGTHTALSPLADPTTRSAYIRHLREMVKADDEAMDDRFLSGQFLAFHADPVLQAMAVASEARERAAKADARASAGESAGPTGRPAARNNQEVLDLFSTGG